MALSDSPAARIVKALGGKNGRANCPLEKHKTPLSLSVDNGKTTAIVVRCHAGCSSLDVLRELRRRSLLVDGRQPTTRGFRPRRQAAPPDPVPVRPDPPPDRGKLDRLRWLDAGNGELRPGKGGIALRVGKLPELYAAIGKAPEAAKAEALLESSR